jgi:hypothetical protein
MKAFFLVFTADATATATRPPRGRIPGNTQDADS